jgi:1-acyl-sn-glycerol-3-phosphate acyltransferase
MTTTHAHPATPGASHASSDSHARREDVSLPQRSDWLWRGFTKYGRWYLKRHFRAVRLATPVPEILTNSDRPLLVCLNHPSWWDPMIGVLLADQLFPTRRHFAPIEAAALTQYRFFEKLGFFGIDPNARHGAERFLRLGSQILHQSNTALWVTAQGEFADVRRRPIALKPGVAHLARRAHDAMVVPLALEYPHWTQRLPEALAMFGRPMLVDTFDGMDTDSWQALLNKRMAETMDELAERSIARDAEAFRTLLAGGSGVGFFYDAWRWMKAKVTGGSFSREHGGDDR